MAPRITGRDGAVLVGVLIVILGVVWGTARVAQLSADRDRLQHQVNTLADQVRGLGGTPKVTPAPGAAGRPGQPGHNGPAGTPGRDGRSGPSGRPGTAGASGPTGAPGTPGTAGQQGEQGPPGPVGPTGPPGKDGADGKDGTDGKAGSPPSSWTFTYLGVTYTCTPTSDGATTYTCEPDGAPVSNSRRRR